MPYFTRHKQGKLYAIYSGRFAFVKPDSYENIKKIFAKVTTEGTEQDSAGEIKSLREEPDSYENVENNLTKESSKEKQRDFSEKTKSLREEFGHSVQFSKMAVGNALNGVRWLIRQFFIYFPFELPVQTYYKLRFLWFCINYQLLESMYKEVQQDLSDSTKPKFDTKTLILEDFRSCKLMYQHAPLATFLLITSMPITIPIGYLLTKHFTVFVLASFDDEIQETGGATPHIASMAEPVDADKQNSGHASKTNSHNDENNNKSQRKAIIEHGTASYTTSLAPRKDFKKIIRIFIEIVQHGYMLKKRPWIIEKWVHIKFKTEKVMFENLPDLNKLNPAFPDYSTYFTKIGQFAIDWAGCTGIRKMEAVVDALECLTTTTDVDLSEVEKLKGIADWHNVLGFFYMHGN
jgi:hypothetical protein